MTEPSTDSTRRRTPVVTFQPLGDGTYRVIGGPHRNALTGRYIFSEPADAGVHDTAPRRNATSG